MTTEDIVPDMDIPLSPRAREHMRSRTLYPIEEEYKAHLNEMVIYGATRAEIQNDREFLKRIEQNPHTAEARWYRQEEHLYELYSKDYDGFLEVIGETYSKICRPAITLAESLEHEISDLKERQAKAEREGNSRAAEALLALLTLRKRQQSKYRDTYSEWQRRDQEVRDKRGLPRRDTIAANLGVRYRLEIPHHIDDVGTYRRLARYHFVYAICGLVVGLICILGGIALFLNGVAGSTAWTAKMLGAESNLSDAAPGALLFVVGLFIVFVTRLSTRVKK